MSRTADLEKAESSAIQAFVRRCLESSQRGEGPPAAQLEVAGRRIAIDVVFVASPRTDPKRLGSRPRLREDKVALRVLRDLERGSSAHVPDGKTLILTLGAPIREAKKLVAAMTETLIAYFESGSDEKDEKRSILGNRVRFRVVSGDPRWASKVAGFVFSGDPKPGALVDAMRSLHDAIAAISKKPGSTRSVGRRWLVLVSDRWIADPKTYRRAHSRLRIPGGYRKTLMVLETGRVEVLVEA